MSSSSLPASHSSTDLLYTIETIKTTVQRLHHPGSLPEHRAQASDWLQSFQNSTQAWDISVTILHQNDTYKDSPELVFFASQTLKHKLDDHQAQALARTIWSLLLSPASSLSKIVLTQLELALAALAIQCPTWTDSVEQAIQVLLSSSTGHTQALNFLNFLAFLPEQLSNRALQGLSHEVHAMQRNRLIGQHAGVVMNLLLTRLGGDNRDSDVSLQGSLLSCILAWIREEPDHVTSLDQGIFGQATLVFVREPNHFRLLFALMLNAVKDGDDQGAGVLSTISEVLSELMHNVMNACHIEHNSQAQQQGYECIEGWMPIITEATLAILRPLVHHQLSLTNGEDLRIAGCQGEEDGTDLIMRSLVSVLADMGQLILYQVSRELNPNHYEPLLQCLEILLQAYHVRSFAVVELSLSVWDILAQYLASPAPPAYQLNDALAPTFGRLFRTLVRLYLSYPSDPDALDQLEEDSDALDQFRSFRHLIGDCLKDSTRVLNSTLTLLILVEELTLAWYGQTMISIQDLPSIEQATLVLDPLTVKPLPESWIPLESVLFALRTVSGVIDKHESEVLEPLLTFLVTKFDPNTAPTKLVYATCLVIGSYSDWLAFKMGIGVGHPGHRGGASSEPFFESLFGYLLTCLRKVQAPRQKFSIHSAACLALKWLCEACGPGVSGSESLLNSLLTVYSELLTGYIGAESETLTIIKLPDLVDLSNAMGMVLMSAPSTLGHVVEPTWASIAHIMFHQLLPKNPAAVLQLTDALIQQASEEESFLTRTKIVSNISVIAQLVEPLLTAIQQHTGPFILSDTSIELLVSFLRRLVAIATQSSKQESSLGGIGPPSFDSLVTSVLNVTRVLLEAGVLQACYVIRFIIQTKIAPMATWAQLCHLASQSPTLQVQTNTLFIDSAPATADYLAMMCAALDMDKELVTSPPQSPTSSLFSHRFHHLVSRTVQIAEQTLARLASLTDQSQALAFLCRTPPAILHATLEHDLLFDALVNRLPPVLIADVAHLLLAEHNLFASNGHLDPGLIPRLETLGHRLVEHHLTKHSFTEKERHDLLQEWMNCFIGNTNTSIGARNRRLRTLLMRINSTCARRK